MVKSVTFRIVVVVSDLVIIYLVTHRLETTIALTILTNLASTVLYYIHERSWNKIGWGKTENTTHPPM